jgi:hypothetical protein
MLNGHSFHYEEDFLMQRLSRWLRAHNPEVSRVAMLAAAMLLSSRATACDSAVNQCPAPVAIASVQALALPLAPLVVRPIAPQSVGLSATVAPTAVSQVVVSPVVTPSAVVPSAVVFPSTLVVPSTLFSLDAICPRRVVVQPARIRAAAVRPARSRTVVRQRTFAR